MDTLYTLDNRTYVDAYHLEAILETGEVTVPGHVPHVTDQCVLNNCLHLVTEQYISLHSYTKTLFKDIHKSGFTL